MKLHKAAEMAIEAIMKGGVKEQAAAVYALRQALAQPEQEPVGYVTIDNISSWAKVPSIKWFKKPTEGQLYTAPPKRDWVGLTDEEIEKCKIDGGLPHTVNWRLSAKIMQAKLKEKNT